VQNRESLYAVLTRSESRVAISVAVKPDTTVRDHSPAFITVCFGAA